MHFTPETGSPRIGYVLKMYPRFSETFIVSEILAHEEAGLDLEIFSLRQPIDGRFHETLARVRAPVTYLPYHDLKLSAFWQQLEGAAERLPGFWPAFEPALHEDPRDAYQAVVLAELLGERGITHLHAHFASSATTVARLAARLAGVSYSFTAHAKDLYHESVQPEDLRRKLADAADVVTVSDFNLGFLREEYSTLAGKARRIYNGLDLETFGYRDPADRPPRIVSVGRLIEKKGMEVLVDACAILRSRGIDFSCEIGGSGPLAPALEERIVRHSLTSQVRLCGPLPQQEVRALVQGAAVFAAPCVVGADGNRDGLPTVLLEAMALGTPCVSTDVTGIPEALQNGVTGLMVPQHDAGALADALQRLLEDAGLRVRLAEAARRLVEDQFDIRRNSVALREVFGLALEEAALGEEAR
jgi:colanic acid/amylovoran biosynthesis glycosyltransferase